MCLYAECSYTILFSVAMLNVFTKNVIILNVFMLSANMLSVVVLLSYSQGSCVRRDFVECRYPESLYADFRRV